MLGRLAKTDTLDAEVIALSPSACVHKHGLFGNKLRGSYLAELVGRRRQIIEMIGMETNRGRQAIDKPPLPEGSRATSPISRRSSTRSTTTSATPSSDSPALGAKPRRS